MVIKSASLKWRCCYILQNPSKSTLIQNSPLGRRIGKDVFLEKSASYFGNIRTKYAKVSSGNFVCTDLQYPFIWMVALPSLLEWNLAKYALSSTYVKNSIEIIPKARQTYFIMAIESIIPWIDISFQIPPHTYCKYSSKLFNLKHGRTILFLGTAIICI